MSPALPALAISGSGTGASDAFAATVLTAAGPHRAAPAGAASDLAIAVRQACAAAAVRLRDVREVRVDRGPGSYIGLRVSTTFARFVAGFAPARLLAADSLQLLAAGALDADPGLSGRRLCPVLAGQRGRVHVAAYRLGADGGLAAELPPTALEAQGLAEIIGPDDVVVASPGTELPPALAARRRPPPPDRTLADCLLLASVRLRETAPEALEPLYLMGSYAG